MSKRRAREMGIPFIGIPGVYNSITGILFAMLTVTSI